MRCSCLLCMGMLGVQEGYTMSCSVCAGHSSYNCPCCGEDVRMVDCPDCDGTGYYFYAFNIQSRKCKRVTQSAYEILPVDEDDANGMSAIWCQGDILPCDTCKGDGEIPEDY